MTQALDRRSLELPASVVDPLRDSLDCDIRAQPYGSVNYGTVALLRPLQGRTMPPRQTHRPISPGHVLVRNPLVGHGQMPIQQPLRDRLQLRRRRWSGRRSGTRRTPHGACPNADRATLPVTHESLLQIPGVPRRYQEEPARRSEYEAGRGCRAGTAGPWPSATYRSAPPPRFGHAGSDPTYVRRHRRAARAAR